VFKSAINIRCVLCESFLLFWLHVFFVRGNLTKLSLYVMWKYVDWYYGFIVRRREKKGLFPKNFICIKDSVTDKSG